MKKIYLMILMCLLCIGIISCGKNNNPDAISDSEKKEVYQLIDDYIDKLLTSSPDRPLWNIETIKSGKAAAWNYIDGCMISSLIDLYEQTNQFEYLSYAGNFIDYYVNEDGEILGYNMDTYNLDNINEGRVLFYLYELTGEQKYKTAIDTLYTQLMNQPRTQEGNFWHKQIYNNQIWLDGLYMAQPFYAMYETVFKNPNERRYDDILNQFENVFNLMYDKEKHLYYHGYDSSKSIFWADSTTGLSSNFWLRSIGWYTIALVDVYSIIDDNEVEIKNRFKELIEITLSGIYEYIDSANNMFYQVVDQGKRSGNYLETSGSLMVSYASLKAARLGIIDKKYYNMGEKVFFGVCKKYLTSVNGDLNLGGICITAGLGPQNNIIRDGSFEYYISEEIVENDAKGVAPLIMAYTELKKGLN